MKSPTRVCKKQEQSEAIDPANLFQGMADSCPAHAFMDRWARLSSASRRNNFSARGMPEKATLGKWGARPMGARVRRAKEGREACRSNAVGEAENAKGRHPKVRPFDPQSTGPKNWRKTGAGEGIRTLDPNLGKVVLYP